MAKAKTVTQYVTVKKKSTRRRSNRGGGGGLPIAIVAGMIPGIAWSIEPAMAGNWPHAMERALAAYTGYYIPEKRFRIDFLARGLFPIALGMLVHNLANKFGVNRALRRIIPIPIGL